MNRKTATAICLLLALALLTGCGAQTGPAATEDPEQIILTGTATPDATAAPTPAPTEELPPPDATPEEPVPEGGHAWTLTPMGLDENLTFDLSGVGDATMVGFFVQDGPDGTEELWLEANGMPARLETGAYAMVCGAWVYVKDGVATLMATLDISSGDYETICWQLRDGAPVQTCRTTGIVEGPTDDGDIVLGTAVNVLGTWWASRPYEMDGAGALTPLPDSLYEIVPPDDMSLKTTDALPVELLDADGSYRAGEVPAGTTLTPMATDAAQYFYFILDDGREGRVVFERREYEVYIDGVSENEYFEELMYAG